MKLGTLELEDFVSGASLVQIYLALFIFTWPHSDLLGLIQIYLALFKFTWPP